jgi:hypothetical protein
MLEAVSTSETLVNFCESCDAATQKTVIFTSNLCSFVKVRDQVSYPHKTSSKLLFSRLGGVMASELAIGPKVRAYKPGRGDGF